MAGSGSVAETATPASLSRRFGAAGARLAHVLGIPSLRLRMAFRPVGRASHDAVLVVAACKPPEHLHTHVVEVEIDGWRGVCGEGCVSVQERSLAWSRTSGNRNRPRRETIFVASTPDGGGRHNLGCRRIGRGPVTRLAFVTLAGNKVGRMRDGSDKEG